MLLSQVKEVEDEDEVEVFLLVEALVQMAEVVEEEEEDLLV
jgi:hypothetical protein